MVLQTRKYMFIHAPKHTVRYHVIEEVPSEFSSRHWGNNSAKGKTSFSTIIVKKLTPTNIGGIMSATHINQGGMCVNIEIWEYISKQLDSSFLLVKSKCKINTFIFNTHIQQQRSFFMVNKMNPLMSKNMNKIVLFSIDERVIRYPFDTSPDTFQTILLILSKKIQCIS